MANLGGGVQGALGGAATGATLGSFFPVVGTGIGAALGGVAGGLGGLFGGGSEGQVKQNQRFNPQQQALQQQLLQLLGPLLQGGIGSRPDYTGFAPIEQNARTQFHTQTIPGLAERFTSMGGAGTRGSSDFAGALGSAGAGLEQGLGALRAQYGLQQQGMQQNYLQNLLGLGFQPSFENYYQKSQPGFGENLLSNAFQAAPSLYQAYGQQQQHNALIEALKHLQAKPA